MDAVEQRICRIIDEKRDEIIAFGRDIFTHAELGFKEVRTASKFVEQMKMLGLDSETGLAVTGVKSYLKPKGSEAGPTLAVIGELDALPIPTQPDAWKETGAAHCCGHNAQLTGVVGAAMALSDPEVRAALGGNICFMAAPAEEFVDLAFKAGLMKEGKIRYGGGKCELIRIGAFDDIGIALGHHIFPGSDFGLYNSSSNGFVNKTVTFEGRAAHAAAYPELGVDALNASTAAIVNIALQQESFRDEDTVRVHGFISAGGTANNVIADHVTMEYSVRAKTIPAYADASRKVDRSLKAAAMATGCGVTIETLPGYMPVQPNPDVAPLEEAFAAVTGATPYHDRSDMLGHTTGSDDFGDVSCLMPLLHFHTGGFTGGLHTPDIRVSDEELAYIVTAKIFALTAYHAMKDDAAFARRSIAGYQPVFDKKKYVEYMESMLTTETVELTPLPELK